MIGGMELRRLTMLTPLVNKTNRAGLIRIQGPALPE